MIRILLITDNINYFQTHTLHCLQSLENLFQFKQPIDENCKMY